MKNSNNSLNSRQTTRHRQMEPDVEQSASKRHKTNDSNGDKHAHSQSLNTLNEEINVNRDNYYLDTIDRNLLDFDFEKVCSVSLVNTNVYSCLVCGRYYQGRSKSSHAYNHSISVDHHVFLNLGNGKFFILPESYEITSQKTLKSLEDISYLLNPKYTEEDIKSLPLKSRDLNNKVYETGFVGLNNLSGNDYENVVLLALAHVPAIRDFYLRLYFKDDIRDLIGRKSELNAKFGMLVRRLWSKYLFRSHVSPHELLQFIADASKKQFSISVQSSPKKFMVWLINQLHSQMVKVTKKHRTIFSDSFQGSIIVTTIPLISREVNKKIEYTSDDEHATEQKTNFWILTLDLPPKSVFMNEDKIEETDIDQLLQKFDGSKRIQTLSDNLKTYKLTSPLPKYLIMHIDRGIEGGSKKGNSTVVKYPKVLDMASYSGSKSPEQYKLFANIKRDLITGTDLKREDDKHEWAISLAKKEDWVTIKDTSVTKCDYELLFLDESYIQVWEKI